VPGDNPPTPTAADPPAVWHARFALISAIVALGLLVLLIAGFVLYVSGTDWGSFPASDPRGAAASVAAAFIALLGAIAVTVGLWMSATDWRGRFAPPAPADPPADEIAANVPAGLGALVEAVGKLKGPTAVLVVGALMMFAAAWVNSSAASAPTTTTTTTTTTMTTTTTSTP